MIVRMLVIVALLVRIVPGPSMSLMTGLPTTGLSMTGLPMTGLSITGFGLSGAFPICVSGDNQSTPGDLPADGSGGKVHDCLLCPICQTVSADAALDTTTITLPAASLWRLAPNARPPATGPPTPPLEIARPRGPPV